jgi:hypothetical protein
MAMVTRIKKIDPRKFLRRVKLSFYKSDKLSWLAISISLAVLVFTVTQTYIDRANKEYLFWSHIVKAKNLEEKYDSKIYPNLLLSAGRVSYILRRAHNNRISCMVMARTTRIPSGKIDIALLILHSEAGSQDEELEQNSFQEIFLENKYLAETLHVNGWRDFVHDYARTHSWWQSLSWATMQLSFIPNSLSLRCNGNIKSISIKPGTVKLLADDVNLAYKDATVMAGPEPQTPNIKSLDFLESQNMPYASYGQSPYSKAANNAVEKATISLTHIIGSIDYKSTIDKSKPPIKTK